MTEKEIIENGQKNEAEKPESITMELLREQKEQNKRLFSVLRTTVISFCLLVALIIGLFIWYLNQYEFASYDINSLDGGNANYIGNDGDIDNGESGSRYKEEEEQKIQKDSNQEEE